MKKIIYYVAISLLALSGCKKSLETEPIILGEIENHTVTAAQAIKIAELQSLYPNTNTSSNGLKVNSVGTVQKKSIQNTKAINYDQANPSFYIINYEQGGFIMVAGDDRSYPILAQSETGTFPIKEGAYYPSGLVNWLYNSNDKIKTIREKNIEPDSIIIAAWSDIQTQSKRTIISDKASKNNGNIKVNDVDPQLPPCTVNGATVTTLYERGPVLQT